MNFQEQLEDLREEKKQLQEDIAEIEEKLSEKSADTKSLRDDLVKLTESIETGEVPASERKGAQSVRGIDRVPVDPETKKPPRGARGRQIRQAIDVITNKQETFKAAELFELLQKADPSISESQRAYLYSKLNDLRDDDVLEKVKRGTWKLAE